jgi:hypothetical protein
MAEFCNYIPFRETLSNTVRLAPVTANPQSGPFAKVYRLVFRGRECWIPVPLPPLTLWREDAPPMTARAKTWQSMACFARPLD